jgi:hypothetical protein
MKIFAIGDLHLSFGEQVDKPMDIFGEAWASHTDRLHESWTSQVSHEDLVIVCGDISWGLRLEEAMADLDWIHRLPGKKLFFKGNHDLWWQSIGKLNQLYDDGTMVFLQNHCYVAEDRDSGRRTAICGSRGWTCPGSDGFTDHDRRIYEREQLRLRMSLEEGKKSGAEQLIGVLHYPPTNDKHQGSGFTDLMSEYGVKTCVYGHLHGKEAFKNGLTGVYNKVEYQLVSLDYVEGNPKEVVI